MTIPKLIANSSGRWVNCPQSPWLEPRYKSIIDNNAQEGTAAHEMAQLLLTGVVGDPIELLDRSASNGVVFTKEIQGFRLGIAGIDYVLDLLWGNSWNVYFAVFPWFSFILLGMFFGKWYKEKNKSNNYLFNSMLISGIVLAVTGGILCYYNFEYHFGDYFHLGPGGVVYLAGFNLILMWLAYKLVTKIKATRY